LLEKIKRNAYLVVGVFLLWQGWSGSQVEAGEEKKEDLPIPTIRASFIREGPREAEALAEGPRDPFSVVKLALQKQEEAMAELGVTDGAGLPAPVETVSKAPMALNLQSTMNAGGVWVARINGHTMSVGDTLPDFDEDDPPVLVAVEGMIAQLRYDGVLITLDLTGEASVAVE
jgi:hypothetical protein